MIEVIINGAEIHSREELYGSLMKQLPVPDWFGKNLDALHDTLTCDILPKENVEAEIMGLCSLKENLGGYADALVTMLSDISCEDPRLTLKITE